MMTLLLALGHLVWVLWLTASVISHRRRLDTVEHELTTLRLLNWPPSPPHGITK